MTLFLVTQRSFVFAGAPNLAAGDLSAGPGTQILEAGTRFEGRFSAASNHLIDKLDAPPGVVPAACVWPVPETVAAIATESGRTGFCRALTDAALGEKADRNYLAALAWFLSDGLTRFGAPSDARIGPFAYSQADWLAGIASMDANAPRIGVEQLFDPVWQASMAAILSGRATKAFTAREGRAPSWVELFFFERLGADGLALLRLDPARPCGDAFAKTPVPGSYGADIAGLPSGETIASVRDGLAAGFTASRADIARLPPHLEFCSDEDAAPWLAVARSVTDGDTATARPTRLAAAFTDFVGAMTREAADVRRSASFAAFCLGQCGVREVQRTLPLGSTGGMPAAWASWGSKAPDRAPAGSIVVARDDNGQARVGLLTALLQGDTARVLLCRDDGPLSIDTVTIPRDRIDALRWLDLSGSSRSGASNPTLGSLSKRYESGSGGPGTVSTGHGDAGGVSYGTYQFASNTGSAAAFVAGLPAELRARFAGTTPGDGNFSAVWIALAAEDNVGFGRLQHDHIKAQFYDVLAAMMRKRVGFDVDARSLALQNGFWSTAVQHGPGGAAGIVTPILERLKSDGPPLADLKSFDHEALCALYAERGRRNDDGSLKYFSNNSAGVQEGVARRFQSELADALRMLESG